MAKKAYVLPTLAEFFEIYLPKTRGLSENTVRSYRDTFRLLLLHVCKRRGLAPEKIEYRHLESGIVTDWLNSLSEERGCSAGTRNQRLAALVTFARFALRKDFDGALAFSAEIERIPKKKTPSLMTPSFMTREEMSILLRLPDLNKKMEDAIGHY